MEEIFKMVFNLSKNENDNGRGKETKSKREEGQPKAVLGILCRDGKVWAEIMD